jgi:hypothetical protein
MSIQSRSYSLPRSWIGTPRQLRWLQGIIVAILIFNLFDAVFTLIWVWCCRAQEANPLLRPLLVEHPVLFVVVKLGLVSFSSFLLWRFRHYPLTVVAIFMIFIVYYALLLYHLGYFGKILSVLLLA